MKTWTVVSSWATLWQPWGSNCRRYGSSVACGAAPQQPRGATGRGYGLSFAFGAALKQQKGARGTKAWKGPLLAMSDEPEATNHQACIRHQASRIMYPASSIKHQAWSMNHQASSIKQQASRYQSDGHMAELVEPVPGCGGTDATSYAIRSAVGM